jgi:hypothetical protein
MNQAIAALEALDSIRAPVMRIRLDYLESDCICHFPALPRYRPSR